MKPSKAPAILMMAYTEYQSDPRVMRAAEAALAAGFAVDFLALRNSAIDPPQEEVRGVRVFHLAQSRYRGEGHLKYILAYGEFFLRCFWQTSWLFFARRYRVIHVNNMPDFMVFSTVIPKILGAKVILDIHDSMPNTFTAKFGKDSFFYQILLRQELLSAGYADTVLTVADPVKDGMLVKHGIPPQKIVVIANFPDPGMFAPTQHAPPTDKIRLCWHGTILFRSGIGNILAALAGVKHRDRISAKIIGEGDYSAQLRDLIYVHGLEDIVTFDNHRYPTREIPHLEDDCNIGIVPLLISPATDHALPVKLLEYIAMGKPAISVRSTAINYYFAEADCLFYDWDNIEALRAILDALCEDPGLLEHYRQRARVLQGKYSWPQEAKKYVTLLKQLSGDMKESTETANAYASSHREQY